MTAPAPPVERPLRSRSPRRSSSTSTRPASASRASPSSRCRSPTATTRSRAGRRGASRRTSGTRGWPSRWSQRSCGHATTAFRRRRRPRRHGRSRSARAAVVQAVVLRLAAELAEQAQAEFRLLTAARASAPARRAGAQLMTGPGFSRRRFGSRQGAALDCPSRWPPSPSSTSTSTREYSILDGACRIPDLVARAAELEMAAVSLTDHGSMAGAVQLFKATQRHGRQADHRVRGLRHRRPPRPDEGLRAPDAARRRQRRLREPDQALEPRLPRGLLLQAARRLGAARAPRRRA